MDNITFVDLQNLIDSGVWRGHYESALWIYDVFLSLVTSRQSEPDFNWPDDFWDVIQGRSSTQSGGRLVQQDTRTPQVIEGPPAVSRTVLVDYSDSEADDDDPPQRLSHDNEVRPSRRVIESDESFSPTDFFEISDPVVSHIRNLNVLGQKYTVTFRDLDRASDLQKLLTTVLESAFERAFRDGDPGDKVTVIIHHPALRTGRWCNGFRFQEDITADRIMAMIEQVQQSAEDFQIDRHIGIEFVRIKPRRGGRPHDPDRWNRRAWMEKHCSGHGSCFIRISNPNDNLCLARAVVVGKARIDKETDPEVARKWDSIRKERLDRKNENTLQKRMAQDLMRRAGLADHSGPCGETEIQKIQDVLAPEYQIKVFSSLAANCLTFEGKVTAEKVIHLYYDTDEEWETGHYIVCTRPHVLFNREYWCDKCNKAMDHLTEHRCTEKCFCCYGKNRCKEPEEKKDWYYCQDCNRWFVSQSCFERHKSAAEQRGAKRQKKNQSVCEKIQRCKDCGQLINKDSRRIKSKNSLGQPVFHYCGKYFCKNCDDWHKEGEQLCFVQKIDKKRKKKKQQVEEEEDGLLDDDETEEEELQNKRLHTKIMLDFECMQEKIFGENSLGNIFEHEPNLCVLTKVCDECEEDVRKRKYGTCRNCKENHEIIKGENCAKKVGKWIFREENKGATVIAHNAKGYDAQFLMQYLLKETWIIPKVVLKGTEIMMLTGNGIRVIDSLNFLPMGLAALPKAFDEKELKKGYFPFRFCTRENANYVGPWPDPWFYDPGNMKKEKRKEFYVWYVQQVGKTFDFQKEIIEYCESDVDILLRCCLKFEELFMKVTGVRPFDVAVTLASACMHVFRRNFMKINSIGKIPNSGYRTGETQSLKCLRWLKWLSHEKDIRIQHARNGGEKKILNYKVDGFHADTKTVYEFHGCVFHGCPRCFQNRGIKVPKSSKTVHEAYERTLDRIKAIEGEGYNVVQIWECDYERKKRLEPAFDLFVRSVEIPTPLNMRDALKGGRTNATKLRYKCKRGEKTFFKDICSLYPTVLKYAEFPLGHPEIITENFQRISKHRKNPYFGVIKCRVIPPTQLLHPVLPYTCNDKLYFPICRTCAENNRQGYCNHETKDRMLTGTWITPELDKALEMGYEIDKIFEIWHYSETDKYDGKDENTGLFTQYINCFFKLKTEASGWPEWVKTDEDKDKFIEECERREGIELDRENVVKNEGLRSLAKLMLNSFWGKFGQRQNMTTDAFVSDPAEFAGIAFDPTNDSQQLFLKIVNEQMALVSYRKNEEFVEVSPHSNPVIAAFTTGHARLRLYEVLEKLGDRVIYFDTDSVFYVTRPGDTYHPPGGAFLGDWTNELEGYGKEAYISEFVSGGPKNYAYKIENVLDKEKTQRSGIVTYKTEYKIKIRGFTLDYHTAAHLNFETLKQKVKAFLSTGDNEPITIVRPRIERVNNDNNCFKVVTKDVKKNYGICYEKRWVLRNGSTLPYGWKKH